MDEWWVDKGKKSDGWTRAGREVDDGERERESGKIRTRQQGEKP